MKSVREAVRSPKLLATLWQQAGGLHRGEVITESLVWAIPGSVEIRVSAEKY